MVIACTRDCYDTCIFSESYKPLNIFPINGFTCSRGMADIRRNDKNRITSPMIDGKEVSLEEAVKYVAKKVSEILKRDQVERIVHVDYDGNQGLLTWYYPARLWNLIGATTTDYSICSAEGHAAIAVHYGNSAGATPEEMVKFKGYVIWGSEASISFIHGWRLMKDKPKVVIDVRVSETAKRSEKYIIVRSGSDVFLAIGIIKGLIDSGNYTTSLLDDFESLKAFVDKYDYQKILSLTGVSRSDLDFLTDFYAKVKPLTVIGFALGRTVNGGEAISLISLIPALLGVNRGFFYSNSMGLGIDFSYLRGLHASKPRKVVGMAELGYEIDDYEFMFVWNSNPLHSLPGANRILEAINDGRLFVVVHDPFFSETAKVANVVIPANTFLEKEDVVYSYWHQYLIYNEPIISPRYGITEIKLMQLLAKELGLSGHPLIAEDPWDALNYALRNTGITVDKLKKEKVVKVNLVPPPQKVKVNPLPSGLNEKLNEMTIAFASHPNYTNSQFKEVYGYREPIAYNSELEGYGKIITDSGEIKVKFVRSKDVPKGVIFMYKNFLIGESGKTLVNAIIGKEKGKYGGTPLLNAGVKKVSLIQEESP
ncbi:MAG: molybdopterin-dependent oxidoreductase [Sulfolobaceae archaeon]|nr:molybdopterin-dependent oxidoreductase [Sulfolobaceae archaeon]